MNETKPECNAPDEEIQPSPRTVTFPAQFGYLVAVRGFVAQEAEACGLSPESVYAVQLAVDEAFTNIIEHAFGGESQENIECCCQGNQEGLKIILRDCGHSFDPERVPWPDLESDLRHRKVGGLGLYLIRKLMDEVQYKYIPPAAGVQGCNVLIMVKHKE